MGYLLGRLLVFVFFGILIYQLFLKPILKSKTLEESQPATGNYFSRIKGFSIVILIYHILAIMLGIINGVSLVYRIPSNSVKLIEPAAYWMIPMMSIILISQTYMLIRLLRKNLKIHELKNYVSPLGIQSFIGLVFSLLLSGHFYYNESNKIVGGFFLLMAIVETAYLAQVIFSTSHFKKHTITKPPLNKFDEFYSKKSVPELLEKLRVAKMTPAALDKEWHEGLIAHLQIRELSEDEKSSLQYILSSDVKTN